MNLFHDTRQTRSYHRHLLDELQETEKTTESESWADFVNRMYGALADDPIERLPQLPLTERDPID